MMKATCALTVVLLLCLGFVVQADVFNLGPGLTNLDMVTVGDAGNAADTRIATPGYGSVSYAYNIGKYEVTAAQYCDFLNHKAKIDTYNLYAASMWGGFRACAIQRSGTSGIYTYSVAASYANRPVNYVSFWDACRFVNWLSNGQGDGDTETGTYTLTAAGVMNNTISRDATWKWAIASEDEWYKAAYYKGGGTDAGYWDYPTQSDSTDRNMENSDSVGATTVVGSYAYTGAYGTFDQGGNVWEWSESIVPTDISSNRCLRGGSFCEDGSYALASYRNSMAPIAESCYHGFRVSEAVPEPASLVALAGGLISLLGVRRRRA